MQWSKRKGKEEKAKSVSGNKGLEKRRENGVQ